MHPARIGLQSSLMRTRTITETVTTPVSGLAAEVVDALYPQWAANEHSIPAAFAVVAEHHTDPVIRHTAAETPLTPVVVAALEAEFWKRLRIERQAQSAR